MRTNTPSIHLFAKNIGDTFATHDHQKLIHRWIIQNKLDNNSNEEEEDDDDDGDGDVDGNHEGMKDDYYHGRFQRLTGYCLCTTINHSMQESKSKSSRHNHNHNRPPPEIELVEYEWVF